MKKTKLFKAISASLALGLVLTGCGASKTDKPADEKKVEKKSDDKNKETQSQKAAKVSELFKGEVTNEGTPIKDGKLIYGILSPEPLTGMFNPVFYLQATDWEVMGNTMAGAFETDRSYRFVQDSDTALVKFHLDKDKNEVVLTINKDAKWNNGDPLSSEDIIATYKLMGNPEYKENIRYGEDFENIEGMKEYHDGEAKEISGITAKDDKTVVIKYKKVSPGLLWGLGFIPEFLNAKQVAEVTDFAKFAEYPLNTKPLSYGPFYIDKVVNGESVLVKANPHFLHKDKQKIKEVLFKVVTPAQASASLKAGDIDLMGNLSTGVWDGVKDAKNGVILGKPMFYMSYIGFKLGKWDKEKGEIVVNPDAKAADARVRQAFGYAVDWDKLNKTLYKGIRFTPTGSGYYPPSRGIFYNPDAEGYAYDPLKANQLLDEAGLKDVDGDGMREDKNGNKLSFNFAIRNVGQDFDEALAQSFLQFWRAVGLDVNLVDGKLMAPSDWSKRVQADDPSIDLFQGAWGLGTNPSPNDLLGRKTQLNFQRYIDENLEKDMELIDSDEMFDDAKLIQAHKKFDKDFRDAAPWIPFSWNTDMLWVNNRVKSVDFVKMGFSEQALYELEITAEEPIK